MLSPNDLTPGTTFIWEGQPYEVIEARHIRYAQRKPVKYVRMRNIINSQYVEQNFHTQDMFQEAEVERIKIKFIYAHRDEFWFHELNDPSKRFELPESTLGQNRFFLKPGMEIEALRFDERIVNIDIPNKMDFKVTEASPGIKGDTQGRAFKEVTLETGFKTKVPLFIETGDIIRINTTTGDYDSRVTKSA